MSLKEKREAMMFSRQTVAQMAGVQITEYGQLEAGKKSPRRRNGKWREAATKLAAFFRCCPEDLFPEASEQEPEFSSGNIEAVPDPSSPDELAAGMELFRKINEVLRTLSNKEEAVIRMRFGIGVADTHSLEEIGNKLDLTRQRIHQIEAKALRKLRHPSRSKRVRVVVEKS